MSLSAAESSSSTSIAAFVPLGEHVSELRVVHVFFGVIDADVSIVVLFSSVII